MFGVGKAPQSGRSPRAVAEHAGGMDLQQTVKDAKPF